VIVGLSTALHGAIPSTRHRRAIHFDDFRLVGIGKPCGRSTSSTSRRPAARGVGKPDIPPVVPAITNAIHALTRRHVRELPIDRARNV